MLKIIISKNEDYSNGAALIKEVCDSSRITCVIYYIEDILRDGEFLDGGHTFYFLTNNENVLGLVDRLCKTKNILVNKEFLALGLRKSEIQKRLRENGIAVPDSFECISESHIRSTAESIGFPLYIKSQKQADLVVKINKIEEMGPFINQLLLKDFYIEKAISTKEYDLKKAYYINGYVELPGSNGLITDKTLIAMLDKVSNVLNLRIYSADLFISTKSNEYLCIDVNPAPALFQSNAARIKLIEYTKEISDQSLNH